MRKVRRELGAKYEAFAHKKGEGGINSVLGRRHADELLIRKKRREVLTKKGKRNGSDRSGGIKGKKTKLP